MDEQINFCSDLWNQLNEDLYIKYVLDYYTDQEIDLLVFRILGEWGGEATTESIKSWLTAYQHTPTNLNRRPNIDQMKCRVLTVPIEEIPIYINYPHPLIRILIKWRLEIAR